MNFLLPFLCFLHLIINVKANEQESPGAVYLSGDAARCDGPLPNFENGFIANGSNDVWTTRSLHCNEGFQLEGNTQIVCLPNGSWSQLFASPCSPSRRPMFCGPLPELANGKFSDLRNGIGSNHSLICDQGYELEGPNSILCLETGNWSAPLGKCQRMAKQPGCRRKPTIPNGTSAWHTKNETGIYIVVFNCNEGYQLDGQGWLQCEAPGRWPEVTSTCKQRSPSQCGPLPTIPNGRIESESSLVGAWGRIICDQGYRKRRNSTIVCTSSGNWSEVRNPCRLCGQVPCQSRRRVVRCGELPSIPNGQISTSSNVVGSKANISCNGGYEFVGRPLISCLERGQWSSVVGGCQLKPRQCSETPPEIANGWIGRGSTYVGATRRIQCNLGYELNGAGFAQCQPSGQWAINQTTCEISNFRGDGTKLNKSAS